MCYDATGCDLVYVWDSFASKMLPCQVERPHGDMKLPGCGSGGFSYSQRRGIIAIESHSFSSVAMPCQIAPHTGDWLLVL